MSDFPCETYAKTFQTLKIEEIATQQEKQNRTKSRHYLQVTNLYLY